MTPPMPYPKLGNLDRTASAMAQVPQTEIDGEVARVSRAVEDVWHAVNRLAKQLSPVLRVEAGESGTAVPEAITTCPLAENIRGVSYRAEEALRYLNSIEGRLAV